MGLGDPRTGRDPFDEPGTSPSRDRDFGPSGETRGFQVPALPTVPTAPGFDEFGNFDIAAADPDERSLLQKAIDKFKESVSVPGVIAGVLAGAITGSAPIGVTVNNLITKGLNRDDAEEIAQRVASGEITPEQGEMVASIRTPTAAGFREGPGTAAGIGGAAGVGVGGTAGAGIGGAAGLVTPGGTTATGITAPTGLTGLPGSLSESARQNIALQEEQLAEIERLTAPFRAAATDVALPTLSAFARGGDVDFTPSALFGRQLETGRQGVLRQQAARGGVKSSGTFERLADLVSGLAAEDVGRFEQGQLALLQSGLGGEEALRQAGTTLTGNIGGILGSLGQGLNLQQQQQAQAERARAQTLASGVSGLGDLALQLFT